MPRKTIKGTGNLGRYSERFVLRVDRATIKNIQVIRKHLWAAQGLQYLPSNSEAVRWACKTAGEFIERALFRDVIGNEIRKEIESGKQPSDLGSEIGTTGSGGDEILGQ